jgi:hypothetical protein
MLTFLLSSTALLSVMAVFRWKAYYDGYHHTPQLDEEIKIFFNRPFIFTLFIIFNYLIIHYLNLIWEPYVFTVQEILTPAAIYFTLIRFYNLYNFDINNQFHGFSISPWNIFYKIFLRPNNIIFKYKR